ncbi:MAG: division/cell wall cluster transcriptional repressor MraZ [Rhodospirillales bacterium]|nr:division/cell wall cluster transcriptional repressor MraZ [Rhodospirillales bacterium]
MALLVGRYVNKIDKKGRVSVPKPFRDSFKGQGFSGLYAYPLFKVPAIEACDEAFMIRLSSSLEDLDMFSDDHDDLASVILENAHPLPFDPEGRIVLPGELLEYANISAQAVFVGRGGRLQIWDPDSYAKHSLQAFERARTRGATLRLRKETEEGTP